METIEAMEMMEIIKLKKKDYIDLIACLTMEKEMFNNILLKPGKMSQIEQNKIKKAKENIEHLIEVITARKGE